MGRIRAIKPGFFLNEELAECGCEAMLLWAGLWTLADREGRLEDRPKRIKAQVFPYTPVEMDTLLDLLGQKGFIFRYSVGGQKYIQIHHWHLHQRPHHTEKQSVIPPMETTTVNSPLKDGEDPEGNGVEVMGNGLMGNGSVRARGTEIHQLAKELNEYWNEFDSLTTHHSQEILTGAERGISARLKDGMTFENLKEAVKVFANVRESPDVFWSYPWDLPEFLSRKSGKWVRACLSDPYEHFRKFEDDRAQLAEEPVWPSREES